ncbi:testis-expressed protein 47 [Numenius arquata]|uniref:testis-expressed protein 47 n=1 Tax=Numenius arquata TaxID=31919 RepID=UPI003D30A073
MAEEAPSPGPPDSPEPPELERRSLLAVRRERRDRAAEGRFPLHRLLVVARLGEGAAAEEVAGHHRGLFETALEDHSGEQVSGLLLLCPSYICHVVEEIKVLVVAHNIPTRLFPDWYVAIATSPMACPQDSTQSESTAEVVAECLTFLLKLAAYIQSLEDDSEDADESVHTLEPELLIPAETINYLCNAEECTSPEDFLRIYLSPSQPALDSGTLHAV